MPRGNSEPGEVNKMKRARHIVELLADERGTFEKAASRYLEQPADKARELKMVEVGWR